MNSEPNLDNDAPAAASQDQPAPQFSINNISRFSFASIIQQDSTTDEDAQKDSLDFGDFLAPINFDEFHNSITTDEPSLSHFPLPGRGPSNAFRPVEENKHFYLSQSTLRRARGRYLVRLLLAGRTRWRVSRTRRQPASAGPLPSPNP